MRERTPIATQAKGRWRGILEGLGVDPKFLTGRHGPCPLCAPGGVGTDRFRWDDKDGKGSFICGTCGAGDGVEFVKRLLGVDFKGAAREIERILGTNPPEIRVRVGPDVEAVKRDMAAIWRKAGPLADLRATEQWWRFRVGALPNTPDLRGTDQLSYPGRRELFCGMVAKVRDAKGNWINLHRTFLDTMGEKARVPEARMVMPLPLPKGSAVRLAPVAKVMGVAEGIETAQAACLLFNIPVWATLTAENLTGFNPPEGCERLIIFGDNDESLTGHWASYTLARRLRMTKFPCDVKLPEAEGFDWNDALIESLEREPVAAA